MSGIGARTKGRDITTGQLTEQDMLSKNGVTKHHIAGGVVYAASLFDYDPTIKPFLNPTFGTAMNQNVSFGGTPELIFDGGSGGTEWVGTGPAVWDFASGGKVELDHGPNNSQALFSDAGTIVSSAYTALTGKIQLDNFTPATQDILFQFQLAGAPLGDPVSMSAFIDTGLSAEQSFSIPITEFNLAGATVDEFTMTVQRSAGHNPHILFDDFQLEETGESLTYSVNVPESEVYMIHQINVLLVGTATDLGLSYDKVINVNRLTNGIRFSRVQNNTTKINLSLRDLSDFLSFSIILDHINDGTNTLLTLSVMLDDPILLDGKSNDSITFTINDDLSGLIKLTALSRGSLRSDPTDQDYLDKHGF